MDVALVKGLAGGLFNRIHNQQQIGIEGALHLLTSLAGAVRGMIDAYRTDVLPNCRDVLLDIVAVHRLDGLGHLREKAEQSATGGLLQAALAFYGTLGAYFTDAISDNGL